MKKKLLVIIGIIVIVIIGIGVKFMLDNKKQEDEMIKIVNSQEAKEVFENGLKVLDSKAFTEEGVIKSYEIDEESIKHNPMGGINGSIYINEYKKFEVLFNLDKNSESKYQKNVISGYSNSLKLLLKENR